MITKYKDFVIIQHKNGNFYLLYWMLVEQSYLNKDVE